MWGSPQHTNFFVFNNLKGLGPLSSRASPHPCVTVSKPPTPKLQALFQFHMFNLSLHVCVCACMCMMCASMYACVWTQPHMYHSTCVESEDNLGISPHLLPCFCVLFYLFLIDLFVVVSGGRVGRKIVYICVHVYMPWSMHEEQRIALWSQFSSTMWVPGIEHISTG